MGSLGVQLCHRCCFLRVRTLLTAFQRDRTLRSRSLRVSLARAQGGLLSVNPHRAVRLERWRGDHLSVLSSRRASPQPADETAVAASPGSHLLPYENCHLEDTVRSDPTPERPLVELDAVPPPSPFEEITDEDASQISVDPGLSPVSVSLRDYVNQSETLRRLVLLGVDLSKLERRPNVGNMLLRLDFEKDVQERLLFLRDVGVEEMHLGPVLTINPFILTENMKNLQARVSYLRLKRFSADAIARMVSKAPHLLNFSVERLDNRLSFFQKQLELNVQKTQDLVTRFPRLLCGKLDPVKENLKVCEMDLGFRKNEVQHMVTRVPKLLTTNKKKLTGIFDYVHNTMGIPHSLIVRFPQVLNARLLRIRERHLFLKHLGRDQFDLAEPNYVSLDQLVSLPDHLFCATIALASLEDFDVFQKTL